MKSFVVIGLGLFGLETAAELYELGCDVLAIDIKEERVNEHANKVSRAVIADAKKREVLKQLGVDKYDCAIVATTSDLATSVLVTMNLKALGLKEIICKAQNETDMEVLETLGATQVIIPEKIAADRLCRKLCKPNVFEYIEVSDKYSIIELLVPKQWIGKSVIDINIRAKYGVNVIAIKREEDVEMDVSFAPNSPLRAEEILVLLGDNDSLNKVQKVR